MTSLATDRPFRRPVGLLLVWAIPFLGAWTAPELLAMPTRQDAPPQVTPPGEVIPADTVPEAPIWNLPAPETHVPAGWATGVWEWDREGLSSTRAFTLLELLEEVPGVVALRGGDYGQPAAATAFGLGPGRVRVFRDGVELPPLDGGVVDLSRVSLTGLDRVRVQRRPGELRVDLLPLRTFDPRPYSFLEVGTGDLSTNLFRATFAHPSALGGAIAVSLDRIDTDGTGGNETGASFGVHARHTFLQSDRGGVAWEFRRMNSRRPAVLWGLRDIQRTDLTLHGRRELVPGLLLGASYQRSSLGVGGGGEIQPDQEGQLNEATRSEWGIRLSLDRDSWWGEGELRHRGGDGWPSSVQALRGGGTIPRLGGGSASVERDGWSDGRGFGVHARIWSDPIFGLAAFAEVEDGTRGVPFWRPMELDEEGEGELEPISEIAPAFTDMRGVRAGVEFRRGRLFLGGAAMEIRADSLHPLGLPLDRGGGVMAASEPRRGWEVSSSLPLSPLLDGLALEGSAQFWDGDEEWRYLPREIYQARIRFHNIFFETENLEVWTDIGVRGRNEMTLPLQDSGDPARFATVPFQQNWFGRLQIRVVAVRIFLHWDNFTIRPANQDFPDRLLPRTRAMYGVRWTMWN